MLLFTTGALRKLPESTDWYERVTRKKKKRGVSGGSTSKTVATSDFTVTVAQVLWYPEPREWNADAYRASTSTSSSSSSCTTEFVRNTVSASGTMLRAPCFGYPGTRGVLKPGMWVLLTNGITARNSYHWWYY
eukprot:3719698-Rhodomonas_salina.2